MAQAVLELYPEAKLAIGPPIDNGFYYDRTKFFPPPEIVFAYGETYIEGVVWSLDVDVLLRNENF